MMIIDKTCLRWHCADNLFREEENKINKLTINDRYLTRLLYHYSLRENGFSLKFDLKGIPRGQSVKVNFVPTKFKKKENK